MTSFVDPEVYATFRSAGGHFVSRSVYGRYTSYVPAPTYVIAAVAKERVATGAKLAMPHINPGHETEVLEEYRTHYGWYEVDVEVSRTRARQFADMGRQILALNEQGAIQPPLTDLERQTIGHLVVLVDRLPAE